MDDTVEVDLDDVEVVEVEMIERAEEVDIGVTATRTGVDVGSDESLTLHHRISTDPSSEVRYAQSR